MRFTLERPNAEIKRRTNVVCIFPNDPAITRLVGALLLEQNDEWQLQRRYLQLEGLQTISDNQAVRLSAVMPDQERPSRPRITTHTPRAGTRSNQVPGLVRNRLILLVAKVGIEPPTHADFQAGTGQHRLFQIKHL